MTGFGSPCGACKFLRRKCVRGCVFAPYFCHEQGAAHFAAIHKVFGASNVSKLLAHLPLADRPEAAVTISYEAQARLRDPIYGCVAHIFALQQQVMTLQAQLASLKAQAAQGMHHDGGAKGVYMSAAAADQLGYGAYDQWSGSNGGGGLAGAPSASHSQQCAYSNGAGHESITALLAAGSDYMQMQSLYHAFEQASDQDTGAMDDGQALGASAAYEAAESSSCGMAASFGVDESGWRSSSGYQDCEDLQSVAYAYLNRS
ncbi:LOB domain-containing protein CRL1-like [Oryza brachyantha]|uniref:LOB domain-containing protein n=1 Tax=Oryza brachyantha TaxID=4533 RepID=J3LK13_ORYBR|nr:LOB domain-containing protein CRL1-like [Oryza brachyantha]